MAKNRLIRNGRNLKQLFIANNKTTKLISWQTGYHMNR